MGATTKTERRRPKPSKRKKPNEPDGLVTTNVSAVKTDGGGGPMVAKNEIESPDEAKMDSWQQNGHTDLLHQGRSIESNFDRRTIYMFDTLFSKQVIKIILKCT